MCYKERLIQQLGMRVSGCLIKQFTDLLSIRVHNCIKLLTTTQCKVNICTRQQLSFPQYVNSLHILCKYGAEIRPSDTCKALSALAPCTAALPASASAKKSTITQSFCSAGGWTWDSFQFCNSITGECRRYDQVIKAATRFTLLSSVFMFIPGFRWAGAPHTSSTPQQCGIYMTWAAVSFAHHSLMRSDSLPCLNLPPSPLEMSGSWAGL